MDYLQELFINEAKPALQGRSGGESYYNKRELFLTLTKDDFTWDDNGNGIYTTGKLNWFNSKDTFGFKLSCAYGSEVYTCTEDTAVYNEVTLPSGGYAAYDDNARIDFCNGCIWDINAEEYVDSDSFNIIYYEGGYYDNLTLKIFKVDKKLMSGSLVEDMYHTKPDTREVFYEAGTLEFTDKSTEWPYKWQTIPVYAHTISDFTYADYPYITDEDVIDDALANETEFVVVWDGVEYNCVCHDGAGMEMFVLGNGNVISTRKPDTGEPFCIMANPYYDSQGLYIATNDTSSSHSVSIYSIVKGEVVPMPAKYLPEHSHSVEDVEGVLPIEKGGTGVAYPYEFVPFVIATGKGSVLAETVSTGGYGRFRVELNENCYWKNECKGSILIARSTNEGSENSNGYRLEVEPYGSSSASTTNLYNPDGTPVTSMTAGTHLIVANDYGSAIMLI